MAVQKVSLGAPGPWVKQSLVLLVAIIATCVIGTASCDRVEVGHVGIRVHIAGSDRGIQDAPVVTGWVVHNPLTEQIIEFPTSVQTVLWSREAREGATSDESISFASSEGVSVNADVSLAFHIDSRKAPRLYGRFRVSDLRSLAHGYVRTVVRDALNEVASEMTVQEIYGSGKTRLLNQAHRRVRDALEPDGFVIDQLTFNSALRLPENVVGAINRAMEATQNSIQAENRVRQIRAEAEQNIARAQGEAEAARRRAQGEADSLLIRARAEAQANEIIRLSTTREVISYRALERWDGHLPVVSGSQNAMPMLTLDATQITAIPEAERRQRLQELLTAGRPMGTPSAPASTSDAGVAHPTQPTGQSATP